MTASAWGVEGDADEVELEEAEWAAELAERARAGVPIDWDGLSRAHPDRGPALRRLLPAMELMASAGLALRAGSAGPALDPLAEPGGGGGLGRLGDFRLVREVGRGGMGVVYEAEQLSLGRRVALKVLPFAAAIDPRQLQRFQLEAQAAALLHHTHIVPIHAVGCERGVHYYAMQLLDGRTLADVIREMRRIEGLESDPAAPDSLATRLLSGLDAVTLRTSGPAAGGEAAAAGADHEPAPAAPLGGSSTSRSRGYFRTAATLGRQAAEALEHAHRNGILHRDIKPANLMIDGRGHLWVTDFGLARFQNDPGMTLSGDMLGTLRYMSPEQALARKVVVDQRTDVYSLGVTLYELITLRQAFPGRDRAEILRRIAQEEPAPPRRLNPAIPRDLETVVLKAMAKEAEDRYATARDLADDLGRVLEHRPVLARRPSLVGRALRFSRRYRATVSAVAALLLITTVLASMAAVEFRRLAGREHQLREQEGVVRAELESRLYFHRIDLAARHWEANDVRDFGPLLDQCPPRLRGWEWYYLKGRRRARSVLHAKHEQTVHGVAFHPSGSRVATVDSQGGVKVWDPGDGREGAAFAAPARRLFAVAYSPDGTRVAAAGDGAVVHVWEAEDGGEAFAIPTAAGRILGLAFRPDGRRMAATGAAGAVAILDPATGRDVGQLVGHAEEVQALAYSPDGAVLASSSEDGDVKLWDPEARRELRTIRGHAGPVRGLGFRPDGRRLATAGGDGVVKVWDPATGREAQSLRGHVGLVTAVAFSPDGGRLASSSEDGDVKLWDVATGQELLTLRGHAGPVQAVAFSPDGSAVVSCGDQGDVRVWDVTDLGDDRIDAGHDGAVRCVAFRPDGRQVASAGMGGEVRLRDAATGAESAILRGHVDVVYGVQYRPDGAELASCGKDGTVRVWDVADGRERLAFAGHDAPVLGVCYGPAGDRIASVDIAGRVLVWDARDARILARLGDGSGGFHGVDFSPDGRLVAAAGRLHTVRVWDASTGRRVYELTGHSGTVKAVKFSPDGVHLASAGADRTIKVWDLANGREALTLAGHTGFIDGLDYSPDGSRIASASWDQAVCVWDTRTGLCTLTLRGHTSRVRDVAFSPDGTRIASVSSDQSLRVWTARLAPPFRAEGAGTGGDTAGRIR